tara:strand:- start:14602 stop:15288 length:687 start_codon:yes stop_codon:yes gene_type:complete
MFLIKNGYFIRLERSIALNGHYYARIKKKSENNLDSSVSCNFTIGFGYDEPFLNKPFIFSLIDMAQTINNPVRNKWVKYINDYPRNPSYLPNKYHICTSWIKISEKTANILNNVISGENYYSFFQSYFTPITTNKIQTDNCRTMILNLIKDSLTEEQFQFMIKYFEGNPLWNDVRNGCLFFQIADEKDNNKIYIKNSHPCGNSTQSCCCNVKKILENENKCVRTLISC